MDRWYSSFIIGFLVFLFLYLVKGNLYQSINIGVAMFIVFFIIFLLIQKNKKTNND